MTVIWNLAVVTMVTLAFWAGFWFGRWWMEREHEARRRERNANVREVKKPRLEFIPEEEEP